MAQRKGAPQAIGTPPAAITAAIRRLLRPFVRLLLAYGIGLPTLIELLKDIYVSVAEHDFPIKGRKQSDSRVSVITGVHRKDVRRLRGGAVPAQIAPPSVLVGSQLIARWTGHPHFLDGRGNPLKLPRLKREGGARSFEALAESVSRDVGPRTILDELIRLGIVRLEKKDIVCLNAAAFVPRSDAEVKTYHFGKNLHDHIAAAVHNLCGDGPPFLERSTHYARLSPRSVTELTHVAERLAMKALQQVNRRANLLKQHDRKENRNMRMNFGVFSYHEEDSEEGAEDNTDTLSSSRHGSSPRQQKESGEPAERHTNTGTDTGHAQRS